MLKTGVTAVTEYLCGLSETPFVDMVREAAVKTSLEPGDTRQPWKGEAAADLVCVGIASSRALPTSSAGHWHPLCYLVSYKRLRSEAFLRRRFFVRKRFSHNFVRILEPKPKSNGERHAAPR